MPGKLICFGDLCVDLVGKVNHSETGSDITLDDFSIRPAGAAVNCAVAAAAEGIEVEMLGLAGDDLFADVVLNHLALSKVGVRHVRRVHGRTGAVISIVDAAGQTKLYSYRGVNAMPYGPIPALADCIYLSGYSFQDAGSRCAAQSLLSSGVPCALDPSYQFARDFQAELLPLEFFLPNLEEARLITRLHSPEDCAAALTRLGVKTAVIKLGREGCYVRSANWAGFVKSEPVSAIDTTGAGDAFAGAFLASILKGHGILNSAQCANAVARTLVSKQRS